MLTFPSSLENVSCDVAWGLKSIQDRVHETSMMILYKVRTYAMLSSLVFGEKM